MSKTSQPKYAIGIMSGTSADGIDASILNISDDKVFYVESSLSRPYPADIKKRIRKLVSQQISNAEESNGLDKDLTRLYAELALEIMGEIDTDQVLVIGCHGQTIHHNPSGDPPFSLQLCDGGLLAELTKQTVVTDFRSSDIKAGGQGAPLAPAFHQTVFSDDSENRAVINIGGISNITFLPAGKIENVIGFDTGPGNTLIDSWCRQYFKSEFDDNGEIARTGELQLDLLDLFIRDPYFDRLPPKSTGQEYFNVSWLKDKMSVWEGWGHSSNEDVLMTITMLTARCIVNQLKQLQPPVDTAYLCGGGANNGLLVDMIKDLSSATITTTNDLGIHPQWVEASAFAWMAYRTINDLPSTLPSVTGARNATVAGEINQP